MDKVLISSKPRKCCNGDLFPTFKIHKPCLTLRQKTDDCYEDITNGNILHENKYFSIKNTNGCIDQSNEYLYLINEEINLVGIDLPPIPQYDGCNDLSDDESDLPSSMPLSENIPQSENIQVFDGLTGIESKTIAVTNLIDIFRSFNWQIFEMHTKCSNTTHSSHICLLCRIRSVSLRVNNAKRKRKIKPVELLSIFDKLSIDISDPAKINMHVSEFIQEALKNCREQEIHFLGNCSKCSSCKYPVSNHDKHLIILKNMNESAFLSIQEVVEDIYNNMNNNHIRNFACDGLKFVAEKEHEILMINFDSPMKLKITDTISISESQYKLYSFAHYTSEGNIKVV